MLPMIPKKHARWEIIISPVPQLRLGQGPYSIWPGQNPPLRHLQTTKRRPNQAPPDSGAIFPVEMFRDIEIGTAANDFVENLLVGGSMAVIYGESNSGKTFYATDLGLHVAAGWDWNGLPPVDQGGVDLSCFGRVARHS